MDKVDEAVGYFNSGYSCSQSILAAFGVDLGITLEQAFRLGAGFGGGMARTDGACGAVSGAVMVLGLKYGSAGTAAADADARAATYDAVSRFMTQFREKHGSVYCSDLLGYNLG